MKFKVQSKVGNSLIFQFSNFPIFFSAAILLFAFVSGCKQDFDVTGKYKEIPVVYGLLNQEDPVHYIRIQKGFLLKGNAYLAAGINDSVYYPDILTVQIKTMPNGPVYTLSRIDGNIVNLPKDSGLFSNTPNWLYSFTGNLDPNKPYRLSVYNTQSRDSVYAEDSLIHDFTIYSPSPASSGYKMNVKDINSPIVTWQAATNGALYDLTVRFNYREYGNDGTLRADTFADVVFARSFTPVSGANPTLDFTASTLLHSLVNGIPSPSSTDVYREFNIAKGMQFMFGVGGGGLASFTNSLTAQSGLASNEALPPYTNIVGGEGLFSTRYFKEVDSVLLSNDGLDSLACNPVSRQLRFRNHLGAICN